VAKSDVNHDLFVFVLTVKRSQIIKRVPVVCPRTRGVWCWSDFCASGCSEVDRLSGYIEVLSAEPAAVHSYSLPIMILSVTVW